jgi:hypothetical protein
MVLNFDQKYTTPYVLKRTKKESPDFSRLSGVQC